MGVHNVGNYGFSPQTFKSKLAFWTFVTLVYCTTHLKDASDILHVWSGSEAHGRLHLTDKSLLLPQPVNSPPQPVTSLPQP
eukprot:118471-Prorocentrum_minimum.AAC.2